jgi:hypothetical protein
MELSLVVVIDKKTNKGRYYAVNNKHYDAMLASGGSSLDDEYEWKWLGDVNISEEILQEEGYQLCQ